MTTQDRDRVKVLHEVKKKHITQKEAADQLGLSRRWVKKLMKRLRKEGDRGVLHRSRGKASNRKIALKVQQKAVRIVRAEYGDFGPTLAAEYLGEQHAIAVGKETLRQWMIQDGIWKPKAAKVENVHVWRPRRSCLGELVQWDTSEHDWLEGRGERLYLIAMIDDATSRLFARFVRHDSTAENMKLLWSYVEKFGRPLSFYTDKASLFQTAEKRKRDEPGVDKDPVEMPPTQIGRALKELGVTWIAAHSPQAKGRVERNFGTAQDRLVKGMRVAMVKTIEQANEYLTNDYLAWWERELTVDAANPDDAHRQLDKSHNLAASLSHVETRQVRPDYTLRWDGKLYQIERQAAVSGLRGANVRVELRLDGSLAARHGERYLPVQQCAVADKPKAARPVKPAKAHRAGGRGSDWNRNFDLNNAPKVWQAAQQSGHRRGEPL
jgi:DNA-binding Lrp family transcriptional regulator